MTNAALHPAAPIFGRHALHVLEQAYAGRGLMERAGAAAAAWVGELCRHPERPLLIVAGPGNNGGDAFVVARLLHERCHAVHVVFAGNPAQLDALPRDADTAREKMLAAGIRIHHNIPDRLWGLVIDGLFGVGLTRPIGGPAVQTVMAMQAAAAHSGCPLLSLDCPSGLDCQTGRALGACVSATHTLSFLGLKPGLLTGDGSDLCGELRNDPLGLTADELAAPFADGGPSDRGATIGSTNLQEALRPRRINCHKGSFGSAGLLGGGPGMLGAACLAGRAALYLGAGRVYVGLLDPQAPPVDPLQPELMLRVGCEAAAQLLDANQVPLTALAVGPGLGRSSVARGWLGRAMASPLPLVLDADALNLLAQDDDLKTQLGARTGSTVLTPHPAEAARLLAESVDAVQADRLAAATSLAATFKAWVVLKGNGSIIAAPDGPWWINTNGNASLATAGTGDVLTGLIVALLAQGNEPGSAARAAVHVHAAAADEWACAQGGFVGLAAGELAPLARRRFNAWIAGQRQPVRQ